MGSERDGVAIPLCVEVACIIDLTSVDIHINTGDLWGPLLVCLTLSMYVANLFGVHSFDDPNPRTNQPLIQQHTTLSTPHPHT